MPRWPLWWHAWQFPDTLYPILGFGQSSREVSGMVVYEWGIGWFSGTSRFLKVPLCPVRSDVVSGHFQHLKCTYLCVRVVLVLERPCLGWINPFFHSLCLGQQSQNCLSFPFCLFGLLYFGQESAWEGSSDGTSPGPIALFPAARAPLGPPSICWECQLSHCWVDSWCHLEPLVPIGGDLSMLSAGIPLVCRAQQEQLVPSSLE